MAKAAFMLKNLLGLRVVQSGYQVGPKSKNNFGHFIDDDIESKQQNDVLHKRICF
jgi:hypothetical protein